MGEMPEGMLLTEFTLKPSTASFAAFSATRLMRPNDERARATLVEQIIGRDGRDVRRLPDRLHWLRWLLADIDSSAHRSTDRL